MNDEFKNFMLLKVNLSYHCAKYKKSYTAPAALSWVKLGSLRLSF
jgi:hypothetical protein